MTGKNRISNILQIQDIGGRCDEWRTTYNQQGFTGFPMHTDLPRCGDLKSNHNASSQSHQLKESIHKTKGLAMAEYAMIASLIAQAVIGAFFRLGNSVWRGIVTISESLGGGASDHGGSDSGSAGGSGLAVRAAPVAVPVAPEVTPVVRVVPEVVLATAAIQVTPILMAATQIARIQLICRDLMRQNLTLPGQPVPPVSPLYP